MATLFSSSLVDTADHHAVLRASVGKLAGGFGRRYFQDVVKRKAKPVELWDALAQAGYIGVHISEAYGGGGSGLASAQLRRRDLDIRGVACPQFSRRQRAPR